ncbi:MAG: translation initiation factor IF-2 [Nanoarchaeota archaeon]
MNDACKDRSLRSPICVVVGHVDHGKSSILDYIRGTNIVAKEAGAITQAIGASIIPIEALRRVCGDLLKATKTDINVPGLLFIDTPGHAAFTSMRERGGSLADIAILAVDITEGVKPQTLEAIQILKQHKTPFVIAANKVDLIQGFRSDKKKSILANIASLPQNVQHAIDTKIYELVGSLHEHGFQSERFDRISDYTKQIGIIPTSAINGDGMPELLMVVTVLAQKYLEDSLHVTVSGPAKGTVLEVKEQQGLGTVLDTVIYDGTLCVNDPIVIGHTSGPIVSKVRALMIPKSVDDMRDAKTKFQATKQVFAATGVRIAAPGIEDAISGMPIEAATEDTLEEAKERIAASVQDVTVDSDEEGVVVKADTLGGVEALLTLLRENEIPVRKATVGAISKKDLMDARASLDSDPVNAVILGFNIKRPEDTEDVAVFCAPVIYKIIDDYLAWKGQEEKKQEQMSLEGLPRACKIEYMKNHTFRQSHPAIIGVTVAGGILKKNTMLMKEGQPLAPVKQVQKESASVDSAQKNDQVAISLDGVTAGRQIHEGETYYSYIDEESFRALKEKKSLLKSDEIEVLKEIAKIMRNDNPVWGF